ncbi:Nn.00g099640.m01.CDS01 [Neocucurbitaria sp. VM-36]
MTVLAEILPVVSRSSHLALELYRAAAESPGIAKDFIKVASAINEFALILKQVGTIIKEDDRLPSHEATESLEDVIKQSQNVMAEIQSVSSDGGNAQNRTKDDVRFPQSDYLRHDSSSLVRLEYLTAHLQALRTTLSVLLQTLYTAQSIMWSKLRPTVSPQQAARAVANERAQLETLILEQQLSILFTYNSHEQAPRPESRLLMETDSSQSIIALEREDTPAPASLRRYQDDHIASLDISPPAESEWLRAVCSVTSSQAEHLLERWTSLPQFDDRLRDAEREVRKHKAEAQQPTVESDSEEERRYRSKLAGNGTKVSQRHDTVQPLFSDSTTIPIAIPIPVSESKYGPKAPLSPAASPRTSRNSLATPASDQYSPVSPRSSISSLPVEAAAAMEAKDEDDEIDLEIPWTLCTRKHYWKYIDAKQVESNTDQLPSLAFMERTSWTEIMASWVCKEALKEAGHRVTQVQKDRKDGRRTKLETCFCIEKPLQFDQVKQLVERTVELYRKTAPPTPPPQPRRSSFQRPPPIDMPKTRALDRDRTPIPRHTYPPLERSTSSMPYSPQPPPLDRSLSVPGPIGVPPSNVQPSAFYVPMPASPYTPQLQLPSGPQSPRVGIYPPQTGPYSPSIMNPSSPQFPYPPSSSSPLTNAFIPPHLQNHAAHSSFAAPQSPLRQSYLNPNSMLKSKYDDTTTSDSESGGRERARRHRSKSRSSYASSGSKKKKSHGTSKAVGALMGVGGLTALLDGLSGL